MKKGSVLVTLIACTLGLTAMAMPVGAAALEKGTKSEHVLDLQLRLSTLGHFQAGATGYYGSITHNAVKKFQKQKGLLANGKADPKTLSLLKKSADPKQNVLEQLARVIHAEARGESFQGQVAVGAVVLNRVQSNEFPDSITKVIFQPRQFSAIQDGQYNLTPGSSAYRAAKAALNGSDPTDGALYYYNPKIATSSWSKSRPMKVRIDQHVFTH
ncbi:MULTISPECIES: cell wall hydrolase [unclassified Paenibacillus]|uniref:cell wall hydrolase n=1 Tax=unclassified Paenibacillus TaxID=185978 RepID=UPI001AE1E12C|nr:MULTISPECIES: cell wall hydrolase [unclassified Paenibacillus]MBP1155790.1 N-acetylmuramoyl-L-alanine amidase [Paenibacillus sp. PvP091]MBP1168824.1 N-acetylmuramoyl-L-alanine amidase [Paenibacillus sp. PvR098]MBP2439852.1 N-acetylmuramoyl-L-alanine amidase [Paenibacillus sp. PvP052]